MTHATPRPADHRLPPERRHCARRRARACGRHAGPDFRRCATRASRRRPGNARRCVALNDRLLAAMGLRWDSLVAPPERWRERAGVRALIAEADALIASEYGNATHALLHDPRLSLTAPFWRERLEACRLRRLRGDRRAPAGRGRGVVVQARAVRAREDAGAVASLPRRRRARQPRHAAHARHLRPPARRSGRRAVACRFGMPLRAEDRARGARGRADLDPPRSQAFRRRAPAGGRRLVLRHRHGRRGRLSPARDAEPGNRSETHDRGARAGGVRSADAGDPAVARAGAGERPRARGTPGRRAGRDPREARRARGLARADAPCARRRATATKPRCATGSTRCRAPATAKAATRASTKRSRSCAATSAGSRTRFPTSPRASRRCGSSWRRRSAISRTSARRSPACRSRSSTSVRPREAQAGQLALAQSHLQALVAEVEQSRAAEHAWNEHNAALARDLEEARNALHSMQSERDALRKERDEATRQLERLKSDLESARTDLKILDQRSHCARRARAGGRPCGVGASRRARPARGERDDAHRRARPSRGRSPQPGRPACRRSSAISHGGWRS